MGDYRIVIEGVGNHGCGREAGNGRLVPRCGQPYCSDCKAIALVKALGSEVKVASLEHWPVPGAAGSMRTFNPGPVDDLVTGTRRGTFNPPAGQPYQGGGYTAVDAAPATGKIMDPSTGEPGPTKYPDNDPADPPS